MKKILMMMVTFILVFTTLLPSYTAFSEEMENYCENMSFSIQTVRAGDELIEGKAEPDSEIELEIGDYEDVFIVGGNGEFEFEIDAELEIGNKILLTNQQHEIKTEVKEVDTAVEMIESKLNAECEVPEELIEENEEITEEENSEENHDNEPNSDDSDEENIEEPLEEFNENVIDEDADEMSEESETVEDEPETSDESAEEVSEETIEEETDESVEEISEDDNSQVTDEEPDETTEESEILDEEVETEEEPEEDSNIKATEQDYEEMTENLPDEEIEENYLEEDEQEIAEEINEKEIEKNRSESSYINSKNYKTNSFLANDETKTIENHIETETERTEIYIKNYGDFTEALNDPDIEVLILSNNITPGADGNDPAIVKPSSGQKIIIGNGNNLKLPGTMTIGKDVNKMIVRDINIETYDVENGFFNIKGTTEIHLDGVSFNSQSVGTTMGKFGTGPDSIVHFYGQNNINTRGTENAMNFKRLIVHENASLNIDHQGSGPALFFESDDSGIEVGNSGKLVVKSNNQVISSDNTVNIIVRSPNEVDFKNTSGGSLFNQAESIRFNVQDTHIHGWEKEQNHKI